MPKSVISNFIWKRLERNRLVDAQNLFLKLEKTEEVFEKEVELEIELQAKRLQFLEIPKTPKSKQNLTKKYTIIRLGFV